MNLNRSMVNSSPNSDWFADSWFDCQWASSNRGRAIKGGEKDSPVYTKENYMNCLAEMRCTPHLVPCIQASGVLMPQAFEYTHILLIGASLLV